MTPADHIVSTLRTALLSGTYRAGAVLPSVRELSRQLRVNKNTLSKAIGVLAEEGFVKVGRGRRAVVADGAAKPGVVDEILRGQLRQALTPIVREARFLGMGPDTLTDAVEKEIAAFYRSTSVRICMVECNRIDGQQFSKELAALLATPVEWKLIEDVTPDMADVFVVPYYHLDDVNPRLPGARVAGVHVAPDPEVLLELLESLRVMDGRVALICGNPDSAQRFGRLFEFYTTKTIPIVCYRDRSATEAVLRADTKVFATPKIFATAEALAAIQRRIGRNRPILFRERIDANSLGPLRLLLREVSGSESPTNVAPGRGRHAARIPRKTRR